VSDRLVEAAYILGISFFALPDFFVPAQLWLFTMLVFGTFMTSFVKAYSEHTGVLSHKQAHGIAGLLERGERVGLLLCALVALPFSALASSAIIALVAVLCFVTFLQRVAIVMES